MARQQTVISREGVYYILIMGFMLAGAILRDINLLMVVSGMMAALLLFSWRLAVITLRAITFARRMPERICSGDLLEVELEIECTQGRLGCWMVSIKDSICRVSANHGGGEEIATTRVLLPRTPALQKSRARYVGRLPRRGRYQFGPAEVSTKFPLGIISRRLTIDDTNLLTVFPRLGRLTHQWLKLHQEAHVGSRETVHRQGLLEGDFHGLRNWRSGDARRWIHWRTTARQGELMVRQFEQHRNRDLALLLDLWQPRSADPSIAEACELAVSFTATIAADLCRRGGSHLLLGVAAEEVRVMRGSASMALLDDVMEALALLEPASLDRLDAVVSDSLESVRPGTNVVLVSTRPVDLSDTERFATLWEDPRKRSWAGRILCINAASDELAGYFQPQ